MHEQAKNRRVDVERTTLRAQVEGEEREAGKGAARRSVLTNRVSSARSLWMVWWQMSMEQAERQELEDLKAEEKRRAEVRG